VSGGNWQIRSMQVTFTRTGDRSYSIAARRASGEVLHMPRGPGYDPWLPHDVVHFVVERHFGIAGGVFGQLAAGGDAGTFFTFPHHRRDRARRLSNRLGALWRRRRPHSPGPGGTLSVRARPRDARKRPRTDRFHPKPVRPPDEHGDDETATVAPRV